MSLFLLVHFCCYTTSHLNSFLQLAPGQGNSQTPYVLSVRDHITFCTIKHINSVNICFKLVRICFSCFVSLQRSDSRIRSCHADSCGRCQTGGKCRMEGYFNVLEHIGLRGFGGLKQDYCWGKFRDTHTPKLAFQIHSINPDLLVTADLKKAVMEGLDVFHICFFCDTNLKEKGSLLWMKLWITSWRVSTFRAACLVLYME